MPFLGGILWTILGCKRAFLIGIPAVAARIALVLKMPRRTAQVSER